MPMPKSRFTCNPFRHRIEHYVNTVLFSPLMDLVIVLFFRYYDFKRSAEKKEHKTMEAAGKVRELFNSTLRFKARKSVSLCP